MKIANLVINILVGLAYTVFGANFFFNFIPMPPMTGDPAAFIGVLASTGFMTVVKVLEIVGGLMLLSGVQRPLGYVILMPITVVIMLFEIFISKQPGIGILLFLLLSFLIWSNRERFLPVVAAA
jgi:putative oxidoreductase